MTASSCVKSPRINQKRWFFALEMLYSVGLAWSQRAATVPRWIPPGSPQPATYLTLTTLPPSGKPGGWRSALLLVKALLRNFYFISLQSLLRYRWNDMKAISLRGCLCGPCERWDFGIKPTCFDSRRRLRCLLFFFFFVLAYIGICLYALLHFKVWNWPQTLELRGDYFPPERWNGHPHVSQPRHFCWQ